MSGYAKTRNPRNIFNVNYGYTKKFTERELKSILDVVNNKS